MKAGENSAAIVGIVMVALVTVALGWFFGISPRLNAASAASAAQEQQEAANAALQLTLDTRKDEAERVPEYIQGIEDVRDALPLTEGVADWRRTLLSMVASNEVTLVQDGVADPVLVGNTLTLAGAAAAVGRESYVETLVFAGLVATPFSFEVAGTPDQMRAFLEDLQGDDHRFFLVSGLDLTTYSSAGVVFGRPVGSGDLSAAISGYFFTLPEVPPTPPVDPAAVPAPTATATADLVE